MGQSVDLQVDDLCHLLAAEGVEYDDVVRVEELWLERGPHDVQHRVAALLRVERRID